MQYGEHGDRLVEPNLWAGWVITTENVVLTYAVDPFGMYVRESARPDHWFAAEHLTDWRPVSTVPADAHWIGFYDQLVRTDGQ